MAGGVDEGLQVVPERGAGGEGVVGAGRSRRRRDRGCRPRRPGSGWRRWSDGASTRGRWPLHRAARGGRHQAGEAEEQEADAGQQAQALDAGCGPTGLLGRGGEPVPRRRSTVIRSADDRACRPVRSAGRPGTPGTGAERKYPRRHGRRRHGHGRSDQDGRPPHPVRQRHRQPRLGAARHRVHKRCPSRLPDRRWPRGGLSRGPPMAGRRTAHLRRDPAPGGQP